MTTAPLKGWKSSDIWKQILRKKVLLRKKLIADWSNGLLSFGAEYLVFQVIKKN